MYAAKAFFGTDRMDFSLVKIAPDGTNVAREYKRFTDVVDDTIDVRVYQGSTSGRPMSRARSSARTWPTGSRALLPAGEVTPPGAQRSCGPRPE